MEANIEYRIQLSETGLHKRPEASGVRVNVTAAQRSSDSAVDSLDVEDSSAYSTFMTNYECWNAENAISSLSNIDNCYFKEIVNLGKRAVPYIYKELQKGPTDLVYALDEIFGHPIKYEGFVSLKQSCDIWLSILRKIDRNL